MAREMDLSSSPYWHSLVHYKPTLFGGYESQADDERFFLAENGKTSPGAELEATIHAFFNESGGDEHPQCRFPARYYWLKQQLGIDAAKLHEQTCEKMQRWAEEIQPGSLTLVFPAAYINGPSSMFGHTLLRVNPADFRKDSPLVAYALNYAADADATDNAITFTYKGLFGGYPGIFSIVPYYEKIKEYSYLENRDIWEYSLDFDRQEVEQLMRHAWEVKDITFDYYFLTENCSYHMLSLMEVARPGLDLTSDFDVRAIPSDTVRAVVEAGLVNKVVYRPSSTTIINHHATELSDGDIALTVALTNSVISPHDPSITAMAPRRHSMVLEQAYDYSRYLASDDGTRDANAANNWALLAARSELGNVDGWQPVPEPEVRPDQGHKTRRMGIGAGRYDDESYVQINFRPAYHDVLDPPGGYSPGAQINFTDLRFRYFYDESRFELDRLIFINVLSLTPRSDYFSPVSWGADWSLERATSKQGRINAMTLTVDGGYSFAPGKNWVLSTLLETRMLTSHRLQKGYSGGLGAKVSLLYQSTATSMELGLNALSFRAGEENDHKSFSYTQSFHFGVDSSLRLQFNRTLDYERYVSGLEAVMAWYF